MALVQPGTDLPGAPYAAVERDLGVGVVTGAVEVSLTSGVTRFAATWDGTQVALLTTVDDRTQSHVSRRHGRPAPTVEPTALALTLTGPFLAAWLREGDRWVARAVVDLVETTPAPDVHDEEWLAGLRADGDRAGCFGQLGLRDLRVVTHADATPYAGPGRGRVLLTATSAGPGGFRTAHTSVWSLDPTTLGLEHRADLFFRRPERPGVLGDHATHLVRDGGRGAGDRWLVAASTWGDFDRRRHPRVTTTLADVGPGPDLLRGSHVLDTRPLEVPAPAGSVGTWDPHLVRDRGDGGDGGDGRWLVTYVSATRFFRFAPAVATGPDLDHLTLRAVARGRTATEGPTLVRREGGWWVLGSDGRDGPRGRRAGYPVLGLDLRDAGRLDAAYPTNLPWPTLLDLPGQEPLLVGFDGTSYGGPLLGYGTHGDVVVQRAQ